VRLYLSCQRVPPDTFYPVAFKDEGVKLQGHNVCETTFLVAANKLLTAPLTALCRFPLRSDPVGA